MVLGPQFLKDYKKTPEDGTEENKNDGGPENMPYNRRKKPDLFIKKKTKKRCAYNSALCAMLRENYWAVTALLK